MLITWATGISSTCAVIIYEAVKSVRLFLVSKT